MNEEKQKLLDYLGFKEEDIPRFRSINLVKYPDWDWVDNEEIDSVELPIIHLETRTGGYNSSRYCLENGKLLSHPKFIFCFDHPGDLTFLEIFYTYEDGGG